jgi:poly(3-hydroxybutyrate) depolymerase
MNTALTRPPFPSLMATYGPTRRQRRPALGLDGTVIDGHSVAVTAETLLTRAFCRLIRFRRDTRRHDPRVLVVAPMSGHFSALVRDMLATLLPYHDVHLIDWQDARDVPAALGPFGIEDYLANLMDCIRVLEGEVHVIGVCQSAIPIVAATALLAADPEPVAPVSMILFNGMIDPHIKSSAVARLGGQSLSSFLMGAAMTPVPAAYPGATRIVYPAGLRHQALLAHLARHIATGGELLSKLLYDDGLEPSRHPFIEAYLSVMDLPATFVLDTLRLTFREAALARGTMTWRDRQVEPAAIRRTALMTVEAGHDDVSSVGQTQAAHDLCRSIPTHMRAHYLQPDVGHFGAFHGRVWREDIMPRLYTFIRAAQSPAVPHRRKRAATA